jgi:hypothetical protein
MMPTAMPAFFLPAKSADAVAVNIPCTPMIAIDITATTQPIPAGAANIGMIAIAPTNMIAYSTAETGLRRDWNR